MGDDYVYIPISCEEHQRRMDEKQREYDAKERLMPEDYEGSPVSVSQGQAFRKWPVTGFQSISVLPFLVGKPWNEVALGYVHALRPSHVRVTTGMVQLDAMVWRVTVLIDDSKTIKNITQEVEIGLPDGVSNGMAMNEALLYGIDSEEVKWHALKGTLSLGLGGMKKVLPDGTSVPFPKR